MAGSVATKRIVVDIWRGVLIAGLRAKPSTGRALPTDLAEFTARSVATTPQIGSGIQGIGHLSQRRPLDR
jgi:hypothetical protein